MPTFPLGRRPGCLPRTTLLGQRCPLAGEHIPVIPRDQWDTLAKKASLRPFIRSIFDQGRNGSCAGESTTQGMATARAFSGQEHVEFNPLSVYHFTCGGRDNGSTIEDNLIRLRDFGACPESVWPRSKGWEATPSEEALEVAKKYRIIEFYDIATLDELVTCLLLDFPVVYGAKGHAILKIQHLDETQGLDVNSWGKGWGDNGFGVWVKYRQINFRYGLYAIRTSTEKKLCLAA